MGRMYRAGNFDLGYQMQSSAFEADRSVSRSFAPFEAPVDRGRYDIRQGPNWFVIALIAVVHAFILYAAIKMDVLHITKPKRDAVLINLMPEQAPPPARQTKVEPKQE